jgi:hypothetical protein
VKEWFLLFQLGDINVREHPDDVKVSSNHCVEELSKLRQCLNEKGVFDF